ncbi:MAG: 5-formyltetrahydrofolate cyclo-ligase [Acinetobacter sp.]
MNLPALPQLRQQLRKQRRNLSTYQQKQACQAVLSHLIRMPQLRYAHHIGIYLDAFGEIATQHIIQYCFKLGKAVYLPRICPMNNRLLWVRIRQYQFHAKRFSLHRLGMNEPKQRGIAVQHLDLLIMPLLACDRQGTRLGMGGGFYDRTLHQTSQRPFRLGLAHSFQLLDTHLPRQTWDQPLHGLCTPEHLIVF